VRVLLGWLFLFGLAAFAGWGTARWRTHAQERADSVTRVPEPEAPGLRAVVVIGAPNGAGPTSVSQGPGITPPGEIGFIVPEPLIDLTPPQPTTWKFTVQPGNTLSKICLEFYDAPGRPPLSQVVEAVAEWNGLENPDDLRVGQDLELPSLEELWPLLPR